MADSKKSMAEMLLASLAETPEWMDSAACKDTEFDPLWSEQVEDFKKVCSTCPVIESCTEKFSNSDDTTRQIQMGVFHGKNYGE